MGKLLLWNVATCTTCSIETVKGRLGKERMVVE